eukprot:4398497-Alexandrium_andersonii.AAC.1
MTMSASTSSARRSSSTRAQRPRKNSAASWRPSSTRKWPTPSWGRTASSTTTSRWGPPASRMPTS